jgi:hypothetical protein
LRFWIRRTLALVSFSFGSYGGVALAQTDVSTKAAAEGLFDQGRDAMKKGDFATACGLLERSQQIDPAVGTLLYLAECYERAGRTASAWATFRDAAASARAVGQTDRARLAEERAERLTPQLSRLTIEVGDGTRAIAGLALRRQGQSVPPAAWNVPVPLDPGKYRIEASAPGYRDWSETVEVASGAVTARILVPMLTPSAADTGAPAPAPVSNPLPVGSAESSAVLDASTSAPSASGADPRRIAAYALAGVGVVGIGIGSFFGLRAIGKNDDAKAFCPRDNQCDDSRGITLTDEASDAATVSNVAFGLGIAALAGGVVLYLTAPEPGSDSPAIAARFSPTGASLRGSF